MSSSLSIFFCIYIPAIPPLSWASTAVILLFTATTLLLLKNSQIPFYQSLNFVLSPSNYPGSGTIFFIGIFLLCTAGTAAVNISSIFGSAGSILLFDTLCLVILNDPSISSNASIVFRPCPAVLSVYYFFLELFSFPVHSFHYMCFVQQINLSCLCL